VREIPPGGGVLALCRFFTYFGFCGRIICKTRCLLRFVFAGVYGLSVNVPSVIRLFALAANSSCNRLSHPHR